MAALDAPIALQAQSLTRRFGTKLAVDELDLEVRAGEVHGFLGPNGSGKSTTVAMLLGLLHPTSGKAFVLGEDVFTAGSSVLPRVGALFETPALYPFLDARDNLRALALMQGGASAEQIDGLLHRVGLDAEAGAKVKGYSLGMRHRLGLAAALLGDPEVLILDEPTNGLDPLGQREVRALIPALAAEGRAVLLASHLLHEVEQVCDRVTVIKEGRRLACGAVADLLQPSGAIVFHVEEPALAEPIVRALPFVTGIEAGQQRLTVQAPHAEAAAINRALAGEGIFASAIIPQRGSLEDVFVELVEEGTT